MKLSKILLLILLIIGLLPALIIGILSYNISNRSLYRAGKQDLEERANFTRDLCEYYYYKISKKEITREQAADEIGTILLGPKIDGKRNTKKGLYAGKDGYIDILRVSDLYCVVDPETEGMYTRDLGETILNMEKMLINALKKGNGKAFVEYLWKNPKDKEYYKKVTALIYFKPLDWRISATATLEEFISPAKTVKVMTVVVILITIIVVFCVSILLSIKLVSPLNKLIKTTTSIGDGNFNLKVPEFKTYEEINILGRSFNNMVSSINNYISKLKEKEQQLLELNVELEKATKAKSEFLAHMSHELRTPLSAVIGFSELLKDGLLGELNTKQKEYLIDIYKSGKHLLSLINDTLDLSKIEAGKMELELEEYDIKDILNDSLFVVKEKAARHNITLNIEIEDIFGKVLIDVKKTKQIIFNLLSNAVKFTPDNGNIYLSARLVPLENVIKYKGGPGFVEFPRVLTKYKNFIEISVKDTGIGIAKEHLGELFKEFGQIDNPLTKMRQEPGTGLGLTLVKKFAELHSGTVTVLSEPNKGSIFIVWLPYRKKDM